jgi:hypothetical protein
MHRINIDFLESTRKRNQFTDQTNEIIKLILVNTNTH